MDRKNKIGRGNGRTILSFLAIVILVVGFGSYYINASSIIGTQGRSLSSLQSVLGSLTSQTTTVTRVITSTFQVVQVSTYTSTLTSTIRETTSYFSTTTTTFVANSKPIPWNSTWFLSNDPGCSGPGGYTPCFSSNISEMVVFNCARAAATPQGCTEQVNSSASSHPSYVITIWYPYVNQPGEQPWANCAFSVPVDYFNHESSYCISLSLDSFIIVTSAPPPPPLT
jgi:hypothetical protein